MVRPPEKSPRPAPPGQVVVRVRVFCWNPAILFDRRDEQLVLHDRPADGTAKVVVTILRAYPEEKKLLCVELVIAKELEQSPSGTRSCRTW